MAPTAKQLNALIGRLASVEDVDVHGDVIGRSYTEVLRWEYPFCPSRTTLPAVVDKEKLHFFVAYRTQTTEEQRKLTYDELRALLNDKQSHAHTHSSAQHSWHCSRIPELRPRRNSITCQCQTEEG